MSIIDVGRSVSDWSDDWGPSRTEEAGSRLVNAKAVRLNRTLALLVV